MNNVLESSGDVTNRAFTQSSSGEVGQVCFQIILREFLALPDVPDHLHCSGLLQKRGTGKLKKQTLSQNEWLVIKHLIV